MPQGIKVSRNAFLAIAIPFVVLLIAAYVVFFVWKPFEAPKINIPVPDGWSDSAEFMKDSVESGIGDTAGAGLDAMYEKTDSYSDYLIAMHVKTKGAKDAPPSGADQAELEKYLEENGDMVRSSFLAGFTAGLEDSDIKSIEAEELGNGDGVIHITAANSTPRSSDYMAMHILMLSKKGTTYMVMLFCSSNAEAEEVVEFLEQNITFK